MIILPSVILAMPAGDDRDYMTWLYEQHHRLMFATAWKYTRDKHAVDDIVSDSCVALIQKISTIREMERVKLRAYIVATVRNTALNLLDKQQRANQHVVPVADEKMNRVPDGADIQRKVELKEELADVWAAISSLSATEQRVMQMRYSQNLSDDEIAVRLGVSEDSIRKYVSRARAHIKAIVYAR